MSAADAPSQDVSEQYAVTAEYFGLMMRAFAPEQSAVLRRALRHADPGAGPVLDLGAGTGDATVDVLDALPGAEVIAVEPARAMRSVLLNRLAARPDLDDRVTVVAGELAAAELPTSLGGVVMLNVLGHFARDQRAELFATFAAHLTPGLPVVLSLQAPAGPVVVPRTLATSTHLGSTEYQAWMEAMPSGEETVRWTMRYVTLRRGEVLDEQLTEYEFHHFGVDQLRDEVGRAGFDIQAGEGEVHVLVRR